MGFNSAFKGLKLLKKNTGNGRLNNLNDPDRRQCVKVVLIALNHSGFYVIPAVVFKGSALPPHIVFICNL